MKRSVRRFLRRRGATDTEIHNAASAGYLAMLVLDRELMPGERKYTMAQLASRAGSEPEAARAIWRAVGFPDIPDGLAVFTDADVDALHRFVKRIDDPWLIDWSLDRALRQARVISSTLTRVAESASDDLAHSFGVAYAAGLDDEGIAEQLIEHFDYEDIARLLDHVSRLQLRATVWRRLVTGDPHTLGSQVAGVGFVDLVGYTVLARELEDEELDALLRHFGDVTHDVVVGEGGRIVKTIGDEVMFVTDTPGAAAAIALRLAELTTEDPDLPKARAALAWGAVLSREGDYFGPVVNLASRLAELARPGEVLASAELARALGDDPRFVTRRLPSRRVRGIGRVETFRVERGAQRAQRTPRGGNRRARR